MEKPNKLDKLLSTIVVAMDYSHDYFHFRLVVICCRQIHVFSFPHSPRRLFTCETRDNPLGLCEVSPLPSADRHILCFPAHKVGAVQLVVSLFWTTILLRQVDMISSTHLSHPFLDLIYLQAMWFFTLMEYPEFLYVAQNSRVKLVYH